MSQNLAENALRYAGLARIVVEGTPEASCIGVNDRGSGTPEDQREQVFVPFVRREEARNLALGWKGLRLSIVRTVVLFHGGALTLENRPGGGLTAQVVFWRRQSGG
ncbi:ATP-binding protein [Novosphingobium terrae]|uniref:ATP-binding protein n=1 Tax=Novosphingobium terrae TaxID=2726189 RepID=UPI001981AF53|nr:ATP-binding protein [Novosphingobium terrae]